MTPCTFPKNLAARFFWVENCSEGVEKTEKKLVTNWPGDRCLATPSKTRKHRRMLILHSENSQGCVLQGKWKYEV